MGKRSSSSKDRKKAKKAKKKSKKQKYDDNTRIIGTTDRKKKEKIQAAPSSVAAQVQVAVTIPLATNLGGDDGSNKTVPPTSGWSWGQAFNAAAQIRPNEDDLDEDFLRRTANGGDGDDNDQQRGDGGGLATIAGMIDDTSKKSHADEPSEPMPESTETTTHKSKKDRKKKSKKRKKKKDDEAIHKDDDNDNDSKRNLKKRRRSSDLSASIDKEDPDPSASASTLEGRMVPSDPIDPSSEPMMVLVDTTLGVVLSGTDRTENGDRIQIGKLVNGEVVLDRSSEGGSNKDDLAAASSFPFPVDADDHCESPLDAYKDLEPILRRICDGRQGFPKKNHPSDLAIYDPYFCDGSVIRNLSSLGFSNVYNKKEDCYKVWSSDNYPEYDVFITNPPYSADHIERLMRHVTSSKLASRPWFLLMPNWVHKKDYYARALDDAGITPFYLIPKNGRRYVYVPPRDFRSKKASDVHKKSSPFMSMWFCYGGTPEKNASLVDWCHRCSGAAWDVARSKSALRDLRRKQQKQKGKGKA